jgi:hypothetical protein
MRKGQSGSWKKHFTPDIEERFEKWEAKWMAGSDLKFEYKV